MAKRKGRKKAITVSVNGGLMDGVLAKGLANPLRAEILSYINEVGAVSPAEMARAGIGMGATYDPDRREEMLSKISYHVRVLDKLGLIFEVDSRPVRGSVEHFYEATSRMLLDLEEWSKLDDKAKREVSVAAVEETMGRATKALTAGTFDSFDERAVINLRLRLDDEGFINIADDITRLMERCEEEEVEAVKRVGRKTERLRHATASLLLYESPPPSAPRRPRS